MPSIPGTAAATRRPAPSRILPASTSERSSTASFSTGDSFRGKINAFRNDLEDYIELTQFGPPVTLTSPPFPAGRVGTYYPFYQYQNIQSAHIQGFEAETMYDTGPWFDGVSAT